MPTGRILREKPYKRIFCRPCNMDAFIDTKFKDIPTCPYCWNPMGVVETSALSYRGKLMNQGDSKEFKVSQPMFGKKKAT